MTTGSGLPTTDNRQPTTKCAWRTSVRGWLNGLGARRRAERTSPTLTEGPIVDTDLLKKLDRLSLSVGSDLIGGLMGEHAAVRKTAGIEFADHRPYSPGDDLRRVDWNAYARLGTLHVRQSQAEHDTSLYLLLDSSPSMQFGTPSKFLMARRLAASFAYIALAHLDAVVLSTPGAGQGSGARGRGPADPLPDSRPLAPGPWPLFHRFRGRAESGEMFRLLQQLKAQSVSAFDALLAGWVSESHSRGKGRIAIVVSDFLLDGWRDGIKTLTSSGFAVTLLHVVSREELTPSDQGDLELIDSETSERMELYLGKEGMAEYKRRVHEWLADVESFSRGQGARYLRVMSDWDIERVMLDMLRRKGVTA